MKLNMYHYILLIHFKKYFINMFSDTKPIYLFKKKRESLQLRRNAACDSIDKRDFGIHSLKSFPFYKERYLQYPRAKI